LCGQHALGYTRNQLLAGMETEYGLGMSIDAVMGAEFHFCPAYDALHMGDNGVPLAPGEQFRPEPIPHNDGDGVSPAG
jgi:hypothetical protein